MNQKKRKFILEAAESLFSKFGTGKTGVDEIAEKARVAKGTIYNYFGSKEGIITGLIKDKIQFFETSLGEKLSSAADPIEKLTVFARERLQFVTKAPYIKDYFTKNRENDETAELIQEIDGKGMELITKILNDARDEGKIDEIDVQKISGVLIKALKGFEREHVNASDEDEASVDSELECFLTIVMNGLSKEIGK
ncbi:MAG TPA: TetR/AcrR family transcriptional regulator [Spirochaetota bacterium]|nr:TetR/AcrR family transcriptional regulator [Spirochaetota bacterium]